MDTSRFAHLARSLSTASPRRGVLSLLAVLPMAGVLLELLEEEASAKKRRQQKRKKVTLCHNGQAIRVKKSKRKKHLRHGDSRGPCQPAPTCTPRTCPTGANCGTIDDGCGGIVTCGACSNPSPACVENSCTVCSDDAQCQEAGLGERCWDEACVCGDVCASGCQFATVQAAIDALPSGSTIRLCAGTYPRPGDANVASIVGKELTLLGAGAGLTILDGGGVSSGHSVVFADQTASVLQDLTVTGALDTTGIFLGAVATLTLADVTVRDNDNDENGGGITNHGGTVILDAGASVRDNHAVLGGGIFSSVGAVTLKAGASVSGNEAVVSGGGINNAGGTVTLHDGASVSGNVAGTTGGGILDINGNVTLDSGSLVCGNTPNQCIGFDDPNGACQATCP